MFRSISLALPLILLAATASAADAPNTITLKDGKFSPAEITIPANEKVTLTVKNEGPKPAEFESSDLNREKIVRPHDEVRVLVGPLKPGKYAFFDDFNRGTTGTLIAK